MCGVVWVADATRIPYVLFPELAALAYEVLQRPNGKWASEPWKLIVTPTCTAVAGTLIGGWLPYGVVTVFLAVCAAIAIVRLLKSPVAPAISAGVLPIVLGVNSWRYPICVVSTLTALTVLMLVWKRVPMAWPLLSFMAPKPRSDSKSWAWLASVLAFVFVVGTVSQITGLRFILFPPLVVMAYEMLQHPETCPWANKLVEFPIVSALSAGIGLWALHTLDNPPVAAAVVLIAVVAMLRLAKLRLPPALAIGLIPFVMRAPTFLYALSVTAGTTTLSVWFFLHQRLLGSSEPTA